MSIESEFSHSAGASQNNRAIGKFQQLILVVIVFAVALVTRYGIVDHPPIYDELYQILPALSWQENQNFSVLDGEYSRGALYTKLIALSFDLAGESSMVSARLIPSVLPGALLVAVVFFWAFRTCGLAAGLFTAVFLLLWPNGIEVSQYVRFYSLQGLLFVVGALLIYTAMVAGLSKARRFIYLLLAAGLLLIGLQLQMLTALGIGAIVAWIALTLGPNWLKSYPLLWWVLAGLILAGAAVLFSGVFTDKILQLWTLYNWEPWPVQNDTTFYHRDFRDNYATFWPLFPVAAIIALRVNFWPASFCITIFSLTFLLQSFGGLKNIRYLYGTMPFFFVIWGIALQAVFPAAWRAFRATCDKIFPVWLPSRARSVLFVGCTATALMFLVGGNVALVRSAKLALGKDQNMLVGKVRWEWTAAKEMVAPWLSKGALIVTSEELRAVNSIGDYDLAYNKPRFSEMLFLLGPDTPPFVTDIRNGRPIIGELDDMTHVMACHPIGIILFDRPGVSSGNAIRLAKYGRSLGAEITVQRNGGMSLFGWEHRFEPSADECSQLYSFQGDFAADRILEGRSLPQVLSSAKAER